MRISDWSSDVCSSDLDYANRDEECCGAVYLPAQDSVAGADGNITAGPSSAAALLRALGGVIIDDPFERQMSITPGRTYRQDVEDYGISAEVVYYFGRARVDERRVGRE